MENQMEFMLYARLAAAAADDDDDDDDDDFLCILEIFNRTVFFHCYIRIF